MHFSLFKFTLVLNSVHLFWKRLVFVPLLLNSETLLCYMFALQLKTVLLLDALQHLMLSAGTLISLEDKMFPLFIFYYKQDTYCLYVISLLDSIMYIIFFSFLTTGHLISLPL
jgi:hypothetical protein